MWILEVNREDWDGPIIVGPFDKQSVMADHRKAWDKALLGGSHLPGVHPGSVTVKRIRFIVPGGTDLGLDYAWLYSQYVQR
jgi:hypothetical protein